MVEDVFEPQSVQQVEKEEGMVVVVVVVGCLTWEWAMQKEVLKRGGEHGKPWKDHTI